jgi:hypothetical protein
MSDLVKLSISEAMLQEFKQKYSPETLPTGETKNGYSFLKEGIAEIRGYRTGTEKYRQMLVQPLNDKVKEINTICKDMIGDLQMIEAPMIELKKVEDDRLAEIKREKELINQRRVAAINKRLIEIQTSPLMLVNASPDELQSAIDDLMLVDPEQDFEEFVDNAIEAVTGSLEQLRVLHQKAVEAVEAKRIIEEQRLTREKEENAAKELLEAQNRKRIEQERIEREDFQKEKAEFEKLKAESATVIVGEVMISDNFEPSPIFITDDVEEANKTIENNRVEMGQAANAIAKITKDSGIAYEIVKAIYCEQIPFISWKTN